MLAIQDTSEINFTTTAERRRGLGETAKGNVHGLLLHPMLAVDADNGTCLGLLSGQIWTRKGRRTVSHDRRDLSDKESQRWIATALAAKPLLAKAAMVTALGDRESDIFALYASASERHFHVIARSMHDRKLADDSGLYATSEAMAAVDQRAIVLSARAQRAERVVPLELRFGAVNLARPQSKFLRHLPESLPLTLVDVREVDPQAGTEPLHWRLLTTHPVANAEQAWRIVDWYKQRWLIEQFFRVLKTQGFRLEDSQVATADRLLKLVAIAAKPRSLPSSSCRRGMAAANSRSTSRSKRTRSRRSLPSIKISKPKANGSRIASARQPCLGCLDHRPSRRLGRLPLVQTARSHHHEARPRILPRRRYRMESEMCACPSAFAGTTLEYHLRFLTSAELTSAR